MARRCSLAAGHEGEGLLPMQLLDCIVVLVGLRSPEG